MNKHPILSTEEINHRLDEMEGWSIKDGKLNKIFEFQNFTQAFGFISKIAIEAEKINHHPELYNVYNKVRISLFTHDINGISEQDFKLAEIIDKLR